MSERILLPASETLASVAYDTAGSTLDVEFRKGPVYRYFMVPRAMLMRIVDADSPGHVYATEIRGRYGEQRLD